jgi:hypothetical protein
MVREYTEMFYVPSLKGTLEEDDPPSV